MWVKICGNTSLEDAVRAAELGADAVGFVFAASRRQVTAAQVGAITPHLPPGVERVGVFYSRNPDEISQIVSDAGLTAVQLHGGLDELLLERLTERFDGSVNIIQTLHWTVYEQPQQGDAGATRQADSSAAQLSDQIAHLAGLGTVDRVLIDSKVGAAGGGTGVAYDWSAAHDVFASAPSGIRFIVAGGLRPSNVEDAIARLSPWGVDVSSGVESSEGRKDHALVAQFIEKAHAPKAA